MREADAGLAVKELCRKYGFSEASYYGWKAKFGGMSVSDAQRLKALGTIGAFNVLGSLFFGWAGGRWSKPALLGDIYIVRSLVLAWYFDAAPTAESTLVFAALMGFLWLGVAPLVSGAVVEMFGLHWQAMVQGLAFSSHQVGSALGAFGGDYLFDLFGNYQLALQVGIGMGLLAGVVQLCSSLPRWGGGLRAMAGSV